MKRKDLRIINCDAYADDESFERNITAKVRSRLDPIDQDLVTMTDEGIKNIKMMVIVALIYEITRS